MSTTNDVISFQSTGDPFVDAGGMALHYLQNVYSEKRLSDLIQLAAEIYVNNWNAKLHSIFHGSKITHDSIKGNDKITQTVNLYSKIINRSNYLQKGNCRICGHEDALYPAGRDQYCLSGSKPFANFHHLHEDGLLVCPSCSIKLFFLPLTLVQMGSMLALLHPTSQTSQDYWIDKTVKVNLDHVGRNTASGILKHKFSNPRNALFDIAREIIIRSDEQQDEHLQLYHFTNFAASPDCSIYHLPSRIFRFLARVYKGNLKQQWYQFVRRHFHISKSQWDIQTASWTDTKANPLKEDDFRNNQNDVYEALLAEKSILPMLRKYAKSCFVNSIKFDSLIASHYAKEVLRMEKKQIQLIQQIADKILELGMKTDSIKKYLVSIEKAGKAHQLRAVLLKVIKDNFKTGGKEPLVTLEDYVNYLFPDGQYWGEIRDLLLIYLYEKMHDNNLASELAKDEDIQETEPVLTTDEY